MMQKVTPEEEGEGDVKVTEVEVTDAWRSGVGAEDAERPEREGVWPEAAALRALVEKQERALLRLRSYLQKSGVDPDEVLAGAGQDPRYLRMQSLGETAKAARDAGDLGCFFREIRKAHGDAYQERGVEIRFQDVSVYAMQSEATTQIRTVVNTVVDCLRGCVTRPAHHERALLNGVSGILRPGIITLVLGPPGAGKTVLMKRLSGKLARAKLRQTGDVLYNGRDGADTSAFFLSKAVGYIDQHDEHMPSLTVAETFAFAFDSLVNTATLQSNPELKALRDDLGSKVDNIIKLLGLEECENTIVGNALIRGISGGQRKRVTTGEILAGEFGAIFADEISTGLDAATTHKLVTILRTVTKAFNLTMVVSLLQPAPEVYALFDDVLLLDAGHIVYHGPREEILPYFEGLGFRMPAVKDVADYLQEVTTEDGRAYIVDAEEGKTDAAPPASTADFVTRWREHPLSQVTGRELLQPVAPGDFRPAVRREFCNTWMTSFRTLMDRAARVKSRDKRTLRISVLQQIIVGSLVAGLFADLPRDAAQSRYGVIFVAIMAFALTATQALPAAFEARAVFYKQRDASFFPTTAYTFANSLIEIPPLSIQIIIWSSIVYFSVGLSDADGGRHYLVFIAVLLLLSLVMGQFFQNLVAYVPSNSMAVPFSAAIIVMLVLFSGFVVAETDIPLYFRWIYYLNPAGHAFLILAQNEFFSSDYSFDVPLGDGTFITASNLFLENQGVSTDKGRASIGVVVLMAYYVLFSTTASLGFHSRRHDRPHATEASRKPSPLPIDPGPPTPLSAGPFTGNSFRAVAKSPRRSMGKTSRPLPLTRTDLAWRDLSYSVDVEKGRTLELLHKVSGYAAAGTCTALMGSSGAGKTTLLDTVCGRKTGGHASGKVLVNGHELDKQSFSRIVGYCEQMDLHLETLTFMESLRFAARLRLPQETTDEDLRAHLEDVVTSLDLQDHRDLQVIYASQEQAKRLTIAVELAANPSILFLDEPTSGLDARAAALVMRAIKQAAESGRAVVATIHQPSQAIFEQFDMLLLLQRGGHTVYFGQLGEGGEDIVRFFSRIEGAPPYPQGTNPAVYMLDCVGASSSAVASYEEAWHRSAGKLLLGERLGQPGLGRPGTQPPLHFPQLFATTIFTQARMCTWRATLSYFRSPQYNVTRLGVACFIALLFGLVYLQQGYDDFSSAYSRIALVFMTTLFIGIISYISAVGPFFQERSVFYRERASNTYTARAYSFSILVAEVPYLFAVALLFTIVYYFTVGLQTSAPHFFEYLLGIFLWISLMTFYGQFWVAAMPTPVAAMAAGSGLIQIFNLFAGFVQPASEIPDQLIFFHWLSPLHYSFEFLLLSQFHDDDTEVEVLQPGVGRVRVPMSAFVEQTFPTFSRDHLDYNIGALVGIIAFFRIGTFLCLAYVNHLKR